MVTIWLITFSLAISNVACQRRFTNGLPSSAKQYKNSRLERASLLRVQRKPWSSIILIAFATGNSKGTQSLIAASACALSEGSTPRFAQPGEDVSNTNASPKPATVLAVTASRACSFNPQHLAAVI